MKPTNHNPYRLRVALVALSFAGIASQSARAATDTWDGAASGIWDTSALNWNSGSVFTPGNDALFTGTPANPVTSATGLTIGAITLDNTFTGTVALTGANTVAGPTTLSGGVLSIAADNHLGASSVTLNGGVLKAALVTAAITNSHVITVGASGGTINVVTPASGTPTYIMGAAGNLTGSGTLSVTGGGALGIAGVGGNVLVLGNANAGYTGNVTVQNGGIIEYVNAGGIASGTFTINTDGMLSANGVNIARNVTLNSGGYLAFQNNNNGVFSGTVALAGTCNVRMQDWWSGTVRSGAISGVISGGGSLNVTSGTGAGGFLVLGGLNSFSGGMTIGGAVVAVGGTSAVETAAVGTGAITVNTNGSLRLGYAVSSNANVVNISNSITLAGGTIFEDDAFQHLTGPLNLTTGGTLGSTYNGAGGDLNKGLFVDGVVSGSGPLTIQRSGYQTNQNYDTSMVYFTNNANTNSGTVTVNPSDRGGSYLGINASSALAAATVNLNGNNTGNKVFGNSPLVFNTGLGTANIGALDGSGDVILLGYNQSTHVQGADAIALNVGGNGASTAYSGIMSGAGSLTKGGAGTLTLSGANTYSGKTRVNAGKIVLGNTLALQNSTYDTGSINGGLDVTGFTTPTLGGLVGSTNLSPTLITGYGSVTDLTLNPQSGITQTYTGQISNGAAGMNLIKTGAGIQILSGANSYTGNTTVNAGTLEVTTLAALPGTVIVNSGGTLGVSQLTSGEIDTLRATGFFFTGAALGIDTTAGDFTYGSNINNTTAAGETLGIRKLGSNTLKLSGTNTYSGATTISAGTLEFSDPLQMSSSSALTIASGATLSLRADADTTFTPASVTGAVGSYTIAVNQITGAGAGKTLTLANAFTAGTASGNSLTVSSTSGDTLLLSSQFGFYGAVNNSSSTINLSGANMTLNAGVNYNGSANGPFLTVNAGSNTLLINGNYTTGNNRWSGIVINNGTVTMANGQNGGSSTNNGVYAVLNGGTLNLNNANAVGGANAGNNFAINGGTLDNTSGSAKTLTRNPVTTINGDFAFSTSGGTSANDLSLGTNTVSLGTAAGTTRTITTNGSATLTVGGIISNGTTANSLTKAGTGILSLTGTNTYTGDTIVNAGVLAVDGDAIANTNKLVINGGKVEVTGTEVVGTLYFGGVQQANGLWGSTSSSAPPAHQDDSRFSGTGVVNVGPAGYTTWADANGATGQTKDQDHDNDGVKNGIEYFMGATGSTFTANPAPVSGTVTWPMGATYTGVYGTDYEVQSSTDLVIWTQVPVGTGDNTVAVTPGASVVYDMPTGGKSFVRLVVKN